MHTVFATSAAVIGVLTEVEAALGRDMVHKIHDHYSDCSPGISFSQRGNFGGGYIEVAVVYLEGKAINQIAVDVLFRASKECPDAAAVKLRRPLCQEDWEIVYDHSGDLFLDSLGRDKNQLSEARSFISSLGLENRRPVAAPNSQALQMIKRLAEFFRQRDMASSAAAA